MSSFVSLLPGFPLPCEDRIQAQANALDQALAQDRAAAQAQGPSASSSGHDSFQDVRDAFQMIQDVVDDQDNVEHTAKKACM